MAGASKGQSDSAGIRTAEALSEKSPWKIANSSLAQNHPRLAPAANQPEAQTLDVAQTDYFLRSTLATACTGERSMVRTLSAAAVQKVRPVMQWWPLQLPSAF